MSNDISINPALSYDHIPMVSVAMTTYNGADYIRIQLDSLLAQTVTDVEVVVYDDDSTDNTPAILADYAAKFSQVRIVRNKRRKGYIKNFEAAIAACRGNFIFLCDQDDYWEPTKIQRHLDAYKDAGTEWVANQAYLIDGNGIACGLLEDFEPNYYGRRSISEAAWGRCIIGCATSFRARVISRYMPIANYAKAHDSWLQLMCGSQRLVVLSERLQAYRIHDTNTVGIKEPRTLKEKQKAWHIYRSLLRGIIFDSRASIRIRLQCAYLYYRTLIGSWLKRI